MNVIARYASLVKFSHTIFALPFALFSYVYAVTVSGAGFEWLLLVKILLCMVLARDAAMGFNRWTDRDIDARNPRTGAREIPSGKISPSAALAFVIVNAVLFIAVAAWINRLAFMLSPLALLVLLGYSYTKRFTSWSHLVLGLALAIAPVGAYIAVTGTVSAFALLLAAVVLTWTAGFDILYSMQDCEFDRAAGLHSIPARFGIRGAVGLSLTLHAVSVAAVTIIGVVYGLGPWYWTGTTLFTGILIVQHTLYRPSRIDRIGASFGLVNGLASVAYSLLGIIGILVG